MVSYDETQLRDDAVIKLYQIGAIKLGNYVLSQEQETPVFVDMRLIISSPEILQTMATLIWRLRQEFNSSLLCGVPYTALTLATSISLQYNIAMVLRRKELKNPNFSDTIKVEGRFTPGQTCLIINDVISSGNSILETATALKEQGLIVREAFVFLDRLVGGKEFLKDQGIKVSSVFTLFSLVKTLIESGELSESDAAYAEKIVESLEEVS